jgi:hypothetical protein
LDPQDTRKKRLKKEKEKKKQELSSPHIWGDRQIV